MSPKERRLPPPSPEEPGTREPEEAAPDLRQALVRLFEVESDEEAPAERVPASAAPSRYRGGLVPPPGPLPRRFGPPPYRVWLTRLVTLGVVLYGVGSWLRTPLERVELDLGLLVAALAVVVAGLYGLRAWQRRRSEVEALAVVFEPAGVRVATTLFSRYLAWGDLVGLDPPAAPGKDWGLRAEVEGRPILVRLPVKQDWARRLVEALRGEPEKSPFG
jgi:hypothetical protein